MFIWKIKLQAFVQKIAERIKRLKTPLHVLILHYATLIAPICLMYIVHHIDKIFKMFIILKRQYD
jgi:hypothetical protein